MTKFNPGDTVRSLIRSGDQRDVGDVFTVFPPPRGEGPFDGYVWYAPKSGVGIGEHNVLMGDAESFELIARAGEPVTYQPGDVVEIVKAKYDLVKGQRITLTEVKPTVSAEVWAGVYGSSKDGFRCSDRLDGMVNLVHRPDPAKVEEPEFQVGDIVELIEDDLPERKGQRFTVTNEEPKGYLWFGDSEYTQLRAHRCKLVSRPEPLTFTPPEPQAGDRVRVTFEGDFVENTDQTLYVTDGSGDRIHLFGPKGQASAGFKIETIEKPLAVGDKVREPAFSRTGTILAIDGDAAFVRIEYESGARRYVLKLNRLERVS